MMQMDDRKWRILDAIIKTYLRTGEPVGSRTISKDADLGLSSATIRNEMSDLEEMGYIIQPHTSAGRIPSDLGYRLYVDRMMQEKEREVTEIKDMMIQKQDRIELILKQMARTLAANTNYASVISAPSYHHIRLKFIQLSMVSETQILAVVVAEGNVVRNKILRNETGMTQDALLRLNILLNSAMNGLSIDEINLNLISKMKEEAGEHSELVGRVVDMVAETIRGEEDREIYTSGATNFFRYPELAGSEKARELIHAFEEKKELADWFSDEFQSDPEPAENAIQVYIGGETQVKTMRDCSIVTATYNLGGGMQGRIGIVGPKRMDYDKVIGTLQTLIEQLDNIYHKKE